jgi:syntaxin 1B/2/3
MGASAIETLLVVDRLSDFRRAARRSGRLPPEDVFLEVTEREKGVKSLRNASIRLLHPHASHAPQPSSGEQVSFMRDFFTSVATIQRTLKDGQERVTLLGSVLEDLLRATTQERHEALSEHLRQVVADATECAHDAKDRIEALSNKAVSEKVQPSRAEVKIQSNMQLVLARKHQQFVLDLQRAQVDVKKALERRQTFEIQLLCPGATDDEVHQMLEAGQTSSQMVMKRMAGAHAVLVDEVQRICDKHQDILRLEQSICELAQMFQDIATLVDSQGDLLNGIEEHVRDATDHTRRGVDELVGARKYQQSSRKWTCYIMLFLTVLALIIFGPVILSK